MEIGYCSWCYSYTLHKKIEQNYIRRNIYECSNCNHRTLECRLCKNFSKGGAFWDDELCHNCNPFEKDFNEENKSVKLIKKQSLGIGRRVIFIDGFLNKDNINFNSWDNIIMNNKFIHNPKYYLKWDSKNLQDFASTLIKHQLTRAFIPYASIAYIGSIIKNPWVDAIAESVKVANILAKKLNDKKKYILVGHSLGARVIFNLLTILSNSNRLNLIDDVYLYGGAVDNNSFKWKKASQAVNNNIYNFYSKNDAVLSYLFKIASFFSESPIGITKVKINNIKNIDVSLRVNGHCEYKDNC